MSSQTTLNGVNNFGDSLLSDQIEANLVSFFNYGLLGIGGFQNIHIPASGAYGGNPPRLRLVTDPNYTDGQVWEAFRKDWVWETGVAYPTQPIQVSGVYVNGGFHSIAETGRYSHHINYPLGQVIFNSPIPASSAVTAEYSYRLFQWYTADTPWWQQMQRDSFRIDDSQFMQQGSGAWDILAQNRVQLPAVIVEAECNTTRKPFELGSIGAIVRQSVSFHILTEMRADKKAMHDIVTAQWQKRIDGFDKNLLFSTDRFPLDDYGSPAGSGNMYPDLIKPTGDGGCYWRQLRFEEMRGYERPRIGDLHYAVVRAGVDVDCP
jgi:hypothetical protein